MISQSQAWKWKMSFVTSRSIINLPDCHKYECCLYENELPWDSGANVDVCLLDCLYTVHACWSGLKTIFLCEKSALTRRSCYPFCPTSINLLAIFNEDRLLATFKKWGKHMPENHIAYVLFECKCLIWQLWHVQNQFFSIRQELNKILT